MTRLARWRSQSGPIGARLVADALVVNAAFLVGLAVRAAGVALFDSSAERHDLRAAAQEVLSFFRHGAPLLTTICLATFGLSGFYTRGRYYTSKYKMVVIAEAVTLAYVVFAFVTTLLSPAHPHPRSSLAVGWLTTLAAVLCARLWAAVWRRLARAEEAGGPASIQPPDGVSQILVIGGAGYIGSVFCRLLLERGYRVRVLDALFYGDESIRPLLANPRFDFIHADSRDVQAVVRSMRGVDAVVHLGEIVGDPATALDHDLTREINVAATRMLAEVAKGFGVSRFIYASSCSVYGASDGWLTELSTVHPISEYARAKVASESILLDLKDERFSPVLLRFATVFGLSPRPRFDLAINVLTARAMVDHDIPVSGGAQWRPFVHVRDVARAILLTLEAPLPLVRGAVFNVGGDELNYTIESAAREIARLVPGARIRVNPADVDCRDYRVSFAKIARELGFRPALSLQDGVLEIVEAVRAGQVAHYSAARYSNVKTLSDGESMPLIRQRHISELYAAPALRVARG